MPTTRGGEEPAAAAAAGSPSGGEERRRGPGVQEWPDGSRYEGAFVDGFKHGVGRYTWRNGEVTSG